MGRARWESGGLGLVRTFGDASSQRDDGQIALGVGVHEVRFHRKGLATDGVLAGRMEMELLQLELRVVDGDLAAGVVVHLDRVAIVDDLAAARLSGS